MLFANRLLLVFFMVALLPFRALAGDVMATQMAAGQAQSAQLAQSNSDFATTSVAASARNYLATDVFDAEKAAFEANQSAQAAHAANAGQAAKVAMAAMPDCPGHVQSGEFAQTDSANDSGTHSNPDGCSACQACHSVAIAPQFGAVISTFSNPAQPTAAAIYFSSASVALGQKPPIF